MKKLITMVLLVTAMAITGCGGDKKPASTPPPKAPDSTTKPAEGGATPAADPAK